MYWDAVYLIQSQNKKYSHSSVGQSAGLMSRRSAVQTRL